MTKSPVYTPLFTSSVADLMSYIRHNSLAGQVNFSMDVLNTNDPSTSRITSITYMLDDIPFYNGDGGLNHIYLKAIYQKYVEWADRIIAEMSHDWIGSQKTNTPDEFIPAIKAAIYGKLCYDDMVALVNHMVERNVDLKKLTWMVNEYTGMEISTMKNHDGVYCCITNRDEVPMYMKIRDAGCDTSLTGFMFNTWMASSYDAGDKSRIFPIRRYPVILGDFNHYNLCLSSDYKCEVIGSELHVTIKSSCEYDSSKFIRLQTTG